MKITLNGGEEFLPEGITLSGLISLKGLKPSAVIVECNGELVKREMWDDIVIKENDRLEFLRLVGGG